MSVLKTYSDENDFTHISVDEMYYINGGSGNSSSEICASLISGGQLYMNIGASCISLGTKGGNLYLSALGAISTIVGACESLLGYAIQNSGGDVNKEMDRYYEHH